MCYKLLFVSILIVLTMDSSGGQVLQFGPCANVPTMKYFDVEKFVGLWYEIERFPAWYELLGHCAFKRIQYCARKIEIEHGYVRDGIQFILHLNSTYIPGNEAVFNIEKTNIDPVGIPLTVISTDYTNYALIHGCRYNEQLDIKYISAWILSREPTLPDAVLMKVYSELSEIPYANLAYMEKVEQRKSRCQYHWTAHIQAESIDEERWK